MSPHFVLAHATTIIMQELPLSKEPEFELCTAACDLFVLCINAKCTAQIQFKLGLLSASLLPRVGDSYSYNV